MDERKINILKAVVYDFVVQSEPVSSGRLQQHYGIDVSTATIRNELAALEELGFLSQPHTSSGRIPTESGYRFYVNSLSKAELDEVEQRDIAKIISEMSQVVEDSMKQVSLLISQLSKYMAVVFAPMMSYSTLSKIDLVQLAPGRILLVMIMSTGCVEKVFIDMDRTPGGDKLAELEVSLNRILSGCSFGDIRARSEKVQYFDPACRPLAEMVISKVAECFKNDEQQRLYLEGTTNILAWPEFDNMKKLRALLETLEQRFLLMQFMKEVIADDDIVVKIGSENKCGLNDCSVITSGVNVNGESMGVLGVIGPTRMDYAKQISIVDFIARELVKLFSKE